MADLRSFRSSRSIVALIGRARYALVIAAFACIVLTCAHASAVKDEEVDWTDEGKRVVDHETMGGTFDSALAFFKNKSEFVFSFRLTESGRKIRISSSWATKHIVRIYDPDGRQWKVHILAAPNYRKVFGLLERVSFRVHGSNGDTGVLPLKECLFTYNGTYAARMNSDLSTLSHHTFGTATDLNASLAPNRNSAENIAVIDDAVRNDLTYNGIVTSGGATWYDFSYSGKGKLTKNRIPEEIVNYLLYELAFYRAGFVWGHYFERKSDAMHFSLTQPVSRDHDGPDGLRKVYAYAEE